MLRSLFAVIVAVLTGLTTAKFVEGAGLALATIDLASLDAGADAPHAAQLIAIFSWMIGAFVASCLALLLGRRWAPLGMLTAAGVMMTASITMASFNFAWYAWPLSLIAIAGAGAVAHLALGARMSYPHGQSQAQGRELFND